LHWGELSRSDTINYTYGTSGKYFPLSYTEVDEMGLFKGVQTMGLYKNRASISSISTNKRFVECGDSTLMITISSFIYATADTSILTYNGGLFPLTIRGKSKVTNFTYATDGRFLTVEDVNSYRSMVTTFKSNSNYLLPISIVTLSGVGMRDTTTRIYSYNENEDLITIVNSLTQSEYGDYVYDAKGNWTSRSARGKVITADVWNAKRFETRQLTYWE